MALMIIGLISDVCHHISQVTQSLSKVPKHNVMIVYKFKMIEVKALALFVVSTNKNNQAFIHNMRLYTSSHMGPFILQGSVWAKKYIPTNTHKHK